MLLLHIQHLAAVVSLHGLYSVLQGFDGFLVVGYLPMQGGVLPFQRLDLVTAEKRTDTLGDVGSCGGCRPFQLLFSDLKGLVFSAIIADFCKSATAFRARRRAPIDRIPTRL